VLSVLKLVWEEKSGLEIKSSKFDPSTCSSWNAVTHAPLEPIDAMTHVLIQDPFPCN
jgi:hypothetical protein